MIRLGCRPTKLWLGDLADKPVLYQPADVAVNPISGNLQQLRQVRRVHRHVGRAHDTLGEVLVEVRLKGAQLRHGHELLDALRGLFPGFGLCKSLSSAHTASSFRATRSHENSSMARSLAALPICKTCK